MQAVFKAPALVIGWQRKQSDTTRRRLGYLFLICGAVGVLWVFMHWAESIWQYADETRKLLHFSFGVMVVVIIASVRWSAKARHWMGPDTWRRQLSVRIDGLTNYADAVEGVWPVEFGGNTPEERDEQKKDFAKLQSQQQAGDRKLNPASRNYDADVLAIGSVDVFVEKALHHLTLRAKSLLAGGFVATGATFFILSVGIYYLYVYLLGRPLPAPMDGFVFGIIALRAAAGAGFVGYLAYFFASLAYACFDEAMTMYSQRHAIRFGRLALHLRYLRDDRKIKTKDLMDVFQWNEKHSSAFRRTRFGEPPKSAISIATELLEQTVRLAKTLKDGKAKDDEEDDGAERPGKEDDAAKNGK